MPITNHADLARKAFEDSGLGAVPVPRPLSAALTFITHLLGLLPRVEQAGYVKGPAGGENVWPIADGTLVRISRVMYPDGQIYKVLNDAPNGGPQWVAEDVEPELYVPFEPQAPDEPDEPNDDLAARVAALEEAVVNLIELSATKERVEAINARLEAVDAASVKKPLPPASHHVHRIFGLKTGGPE